MTTERHSMRTDAPFTSPRKKPGIYWWLAGVFLLLVCLFLYQLFGPNPRIIVSPQTTYITAPLAENGLPDYEKHYRDSFRQGVTPENNAAALLFEALGPDDLDPKDADVLAKELGLAEVPTKETSLRPLYSAQNRKRMAAWLHEQGRLKLPGQTVNDDVIQQVLNLAPSSSVEAEQLLAVVDTELDRAASRPWTSDQIPPIAKWLGENDQHLNTIVAASKRPRYYSPPLGVLNGDHDLLPSMLAIRNSREAARALPARAMWHLGEGRPNDAWQDILAIHRLAKLLTEERMIVSQLVAYAISNMACESTQTLLDQGKLSTQQVKQIQRDLASLPNFAVAGALDKGERLFGLDSIVLLGSTGASTLIADDLTSGGPTLPRLGAVSVDWNVVLRDVNVCYDQLVAMAALPTRADRLAALANVEAGIRQMEDNLRSPSSLVASAFSQQRRSKLVSGGMMSLIMPAMSTVANAQDRTNATLELTRVAVALAVYRAEHDTYPEKLSELVPAAVAKLPVDPFTEKSFIYARVDPGYLLYSAGENGADEGGSNESMNVCEGNSLDDTATPNLQPQIPTGSDDWSIRVPRPAFQLPKSRRSGCA